jgi:SAM-dependent methyltransferase
MRSRKAAARYPPSVSASRTEIAAALGRLPASLAATVREVDRTIASGERMPASDLDGYLATGESALKAIRLALSAARAQAPSRILDLPCGHGRVLRWLRAAYPDAEIVASDLLEDGVDFCAAQYGARPVLSELRPTADRFGTDFDLIWVGSLLTHLDVTQWDVFFGVFRDLLAPGGVLVVTTHGELVAERMRRGHLYGYPAPVVIRALRAYEHTGFAFLPESPDSVEYGLTIARPAWTIARAMRAASDLRVACYTEALWANHQDVIALVRRPLDPDVADTPFT